jgi:hypothetical protein
MTSQTTHPIAAPWRGAVHLRPRVGGRGPRPAEELRFRVRGGAGAELVLLSLLTEWALLWGLFLAALA